MRVRNVLVCTSQTPLVEYGGTESLVESLSGALRDRGLAVDVVRIPFRHYPKEEILKGHLVWRLIDITESEGQPVDLVIATKFPSYLVQHPNKVTWLVQQFRQAYDWMGTPHSPFGTSAEDQQLVRAIRRLDSSALAESKRLFAISRNVASRLARYNGLQATPLYPPPQHEGRYRSNGYGDYILSPSRLNPMKRVHLLIEALALTETRVQGVVAGTGPAEQELKNLVRRHRLTDRVTFTGAVGPDRLLELYAGCLAVFFAPFDEDYGLVTLEAFNSQKPVLTSYDSGGVLEFVEDGKSGFVASVGRPEELASAIDQLYRDRALCEQLGQSGQEKVKEITWDRTIDRLLGS